MSKIVITGGAGFIGSHISEALVSNHEVVVIDDMDSYYSPSLKQDNLDAIRSNGEFNFIQGDITDAQLVKDIIDDTVDYIYHEAAQAGVRVSVKNPLKTTAVNIIGTINVLQASLDAGVKRVVNASSSSVYGKVQYLPFDEKHPTQPVSPYGVSKLAAEHYCRIFYEIYGLPTVSLRYFTVYGPRMRPDLGISIFTRKMIANEPILVFGDGKQTRDFTYIDDVVKANLNLLKTSAADGYIMNIGGGYRITVNDLIAHLKKIIGSESKVVYSETQKGDVEHTMADVQLARELIGYQPEIFIEKGLGRFVEWYRDIGSVRHGRTQYF